jgi:uncharacterized cupin superfamily protein
LEKEIVIKSLKLSKDSRKFIDGSTRSAENLRTSYVGLGTYKPGWCWSKHAGKQTGKPSQNHIGYVISGSFIVKSTSGEEKVVIPGDAFELTPGHDAWVNGTEPCIALDFGCNQKHEND